VRHECPVGRSLSRASSRLGDAYLCGFCFAWISPHFWAPALNEPKQSPTLRVSGCSLRRWVLPNSAIPRVPWMARSFRCRLLLVQPSNDALDLEIRPALRREIVSFGDALYAVRRTDVFEHYIRQTQAICPASPNNFQDPLP
jgi:hypothetical protein